MKIIPYAILSTILFSYSVNASMLASPDGVSDRRAKAELSKNSDDDDNTTTEAYSPIDSGIFANKPSTSTNPYANPKVILPDNVVLFTNLDSYNDISKIYGMSNLISPLSKIHNISQDKNNTPAKAGKFIAEQMKYWPARTVFIALIHNDKFKDTYPKLALTESQHVIISYNDGTLDAVNKISPIIGIMNIDNTVQCLPKLKNDNYWNAICKSISIADKIMRIEAAGYRVNEDIISPSEQTSPNEKLEEKEDNQDDTIDLSKDLQNMSNENSDNNSSVAPVKSVRKTLIQQDSEHSKTNDKPLQNNKKTTQPKSASKVSVKEKKSTKTKAHATKDKKELTQNKISSTKKPKHKNTNFKTETLDDSGDGFY